MTDKLLNDMTVIRDIAEVDRTYPDLDLLVQVLDAAIEALSANTVAPDDALERVRAVLDRTDISLAGRIATAQSIIGRALATNDAPTDPSGIVVMDDDAELVEREFKNGFVLGFDHRGRTDDPTEAVKGAEREWQARATIRSLPQAKGGA